MWGTPVTSTNLTNFRILYYKAKKHTLILNWKQKLTALSPYDTTCLRNFTVSAHLPQTWTHCFTLPQYVTVLTLQTSKATAGKFPVVR